jgi:hypothetical protein
MGLSAPSRNFLRRLRPDLTRGRRAGAAKPSNSPGEALISLCETKRFAGHGVSHWNPYGRRISHFAVLFVFNGLASFSLRPFSQIVCFQGLRSIFRCAVTAKLGALWRAASLTPLGRVHSSSRDERPPGRPIDTALQAATSTIRHCVTCFL